MDDTVESFESEEIEDDDDMIYATNNDIPDIIEFYGQRPHLSLDANHCGKPIFNNRCSKNHQLYNPIIIPRDHIILNSAKAMSFTNPVGNNPVKRLEKFRMSKGSQKFYNGKKSPVASPVSDIKQVNSKFILLKPTLINKGAPFPNI